VTEPARSDATIPGAGSPIAEEIRLQLADAWGDMGAAWGVAPAIARVHAYLMARQEPLTEREVREALGLSHRAASLALSEAEAWGLVERVAEPRRVGRRGPAGTAYMAIGDHWRWFGRVVAERKVREGDPIVAVLEHTLADTSIALTRHPQDADLIRLRDWLSTFLVFVRLFDRAVGLVSRLEPTELERALRLLGEVPDETIMRRGRPGPGRGAVAPVAHVGAAGNHADERGGQDPGALTLRRRRVRIPPHGRVRTRSSFAHRVRTGRSPRFARHRRRHPGSGSPAGPVR